LVGAVVPLSKKYTRPVPVPVVGLPFVKVTVRLPLRSRLGLLGLDEKNRVSVPPLSVRLEVPVSAPDPRGDRVGRPWPQRAVPG
jgi:hypothetical protein